MKICTVCKKELSEDNFYKKGEYKGRIYLCPECKKCWEKRMNKYNKPRDYSSPKWRLHNIKTGAKRRGHSFNLTKDEFISFWNNDCFYCGEKIKGVGLDRRDNNKGYKMDNVVPCCWRCNRSKHEMNQEEFVSFCRLIADRF